MTDLTPVTLTVEVDLDEWATETVDDDGQLSHDAARYVQLQLRGVAALHNATVHSPAPCFVEANGLGDTVLWFGQPGDPRPQHVLMQSDLDAYPGLWSWLTRGATVVPS